MPGSSLQKVFLFISVLALCAVPAVARAEVYAAHTRVELIAETSSVPRQGELWVGVLMTMDPDWHVYWRNPGDSGLAPSFKWTLPTGFTAGDIHWPYPHRIAAGPLVTFGYEKQVLFAVPVTVPSSGRLPSEIEIKLNVSWLACKVECIPGKAEMTLFLPTFSSGNKLALSEHAPFFSEARSRWPVEWSDLKARVVPSADFWNWEIDAPIARIGKVHFFPFRDDVIENAAEQSLALDGEAYRLNVRRSTLSRDVPEYLEGILVHEDGWDRDGKIKAVTVRAPVALAPVAPSNDASLTWWLACLFAFLGGIVLNAMPCVLPVLSIKVLQLVQKETDRHRALAHAGFFALGIMSAFWALAALLMVLKAAGHAVGWGFQFQSPVFVFVIAVILFVFALNLFGVFEVSVPTPGTRPSAKGLGGAFASGIFMTVVATPCTAPFMGSALGFALAQPWPIGILIFTFLGAGLALPMVLLTAVPALSRFVPKAGPWMVNLKHLLGFVLLGCVIWLLSVLGAQAGLDSVVKILAILLVAALGLWLIGRERRWLGVVVLATVLVAGFLGLRSENSTDGIAWRPYDPAAVAEARAAGRPVFIDFTAAWCLTCKVNDLTVLRSPSVVEIFKARKVEAFMADWTNQDPAISEALRAFGRDSVPVYAYYAPGSQEAILLPEILTSAIVRDVVGQ